MKKAAGFFCLIHFVLLTGCLAEPYPGIVVGNPDEEGAPVPGVPGEGPDEGIPGTGSNQPSPADPVSGGDPSSGFVDKEPEEDTEADTQDQKVPGTDRMAPEPAGPEPTPSRPEHAESPQNEVVGFKTLSF